MKLRRCLFPITILALALIAPGCAQARVGYYIMRQLVDVPMDRLIKNLVLEVHLNPQALGLRLDLARAHALVYALGSSRPTYPVQQDELKRPHWLPQTPRAATAYGNASAAARAHLAVAIRTYTELLDVIRDDDALFATAHLGRGWCEQQAGNNKAAIADFRAVLKKNSAGSPGTGEFKPAAEWQDLEYEAAGYLVELLQPAQDANAQDAKEIAQLREQSRLYRQNLPRLPNYIQRCGPPTAMTPIAIPLLKDTPLTDIEDRNARVAFNADPRNSGRHWSWITPRAGWLAYDPKKTGKITSGIHLFGNISYWMFWDNGYQAMSALDDNGDGKLSGKELEGLVVWVDANGNGVCDPGEIKSLASLGIKALSYSHEPLRGHPDHIVYSPHGVAYQDGSTGPSYDIILHAKP